MWRILMLVVIAAPAVADAQRNLAAQAVAEQRVALVVGNASYKNSPLKNPVNDARAMAAELQRLGFVVIKRENMTARQIGPALREFRSRLSAGSTALFFYAGHGLQVKGVNYLPTVDAEIEAEEDVPTQALDVSKVLELMEEAKTRVNLVFLDACRDNPFARKFRGGSRGLAKVDAASGTLISFATRPGSVAADGEGANGLYTEHLLKQMEAPGVPIEQLLKRVGAGVKLASKGKQEPWSEGLIEGEFFFSRGAIASSPNPPAVDPLALELDFWNSVKDSKNADELKAYLEQYPKGRYATLARARIKALSTTPANTATPTASAAEQVAAATQSSASSSSSTSKSEWMTLAERKQEFERQVRNGLYPYETEGECRNGIERFRAIWKPIPPGAGYGTWINMSREEYERKDEDLRSKGYARIWLQHFTNCKGHDRYQAFWLKLNSPSQQVESAAPTEHNPTQVASVTPSSPSKTRLTIIEQAAGSGPTVVTGKPVTVHYDAWLSEDGVNKGRRFDSTRDRGKPFTFDLGAGRVIPGFDQGVAGMKVGGRRTVSIPPELGYGARGIGNVPPNSTLIFEIEVLSLGTGPVSH